LADLDAGFFNTGPSEAAAKPDEQTEWSPVTRRQGDPRMLARTPAESARQKSGSALTSKLMGKSLGETRSAQRATKKGQPLPLPALRLTSTGQRLQREGEDDDDPKSEEQREQWVPTGPMPGPRRNLQIGSHRNNGVGSVEGSTTTPSVPESLVKARSRVDDDEDETMGGSPTDLDALARQILPIVKRLMSIERERRAVR
jgi:hypothetical protein